MLIDANGTRLHFQRAGKGQAVVLIHALACDLTLWDPQFYALAAGHDVIRYDVRGHGQSAMTGPAFSYEDLADDLIGLLDALGIASAHLVGLSLGGVIARLAALRHPQRVSGLVLCATLAAPALTASSRLDRAGQVTEHGMAAVEQASLAQWFPAGAIAADTAAVRKVRAMLRATPPQGYIAACRATLGMDLAARQAGIRQPTRVLIGDADPALETLAPQRLADTIPGARLHVLPGASHFPNLDQPAAFNDLVEAAIALR